MTEKPEIIDAEFEVVTGPGAKPHPVDTPGTWPFRIVKIVQAAMLTAMMMGAGFVVRACSGQG